MSVKYLKVLDLFLCEERAGHRAVKFPRGTIRVEDAVTEKRAHKPMKPLSYENLQRHFSTRRWTEANLSRTSQTLSLTLTAVTKRKGRDDQLPNG